jgi:hypothetical protein
VLTLVAQWEIYSTVDGGAELDVALAPAQRATFQQALVRRWALAVSRTYELG